MEIKLKGRGSLHLHGPKELLRARKCVGERDRKISARACIGGAVQSRPRIGGEVCGRLNGIAVVGQCIEADNQVR